MMTDNRATENDKPRSWLVSCLSLSFIVIVTLLVADWHANGALLNPNTLSLDGAGSSSRRHRRRQLLGEQGTAQDDEKNALNDDDTSRDETCRKYLLNFLNGTTDEKDECDGMKNAYEAADCEDSNSLFRFMRKHHPHHHDNDTTDDVLIDDYFEAWQCCANIYDFYTANCQRPELASFKLLAIVSVLVLCGLFMSLLKTFSVDFIPDAAACILVGAVVGGVVKVVAPSLIQQNVSFDNDLFLHILLPPIIFQAAININKQAFRRDLFPILTFAIFGTVLSSVTIGFLTYYLSQLLGEKLPLLDSLIFGSLISSIDPVATLGVLAGAGVSKTDTLYTLIFGESLLNDGVAIVLFDTMVTHLGDAAEVDDNLVHEIVVGFFKCTLISICVGIGCGIVCTIYFWALRRKHTAVVETALFFCFALLPFYIADGLGFSGIIGIMTMGFFVDFFVIGGCQSDDIQWMAFMERQNEIFRPPDGRTRWYHVYRAFKGTGHLSSRSRHHVGFVAEVIASIMEMAIFAYLGLFLYDQHFWNFRLDSIAVFGCIVSRALMVVLFSLVINFFVWLDIERRIGQCVCPEDVTSRRLRQMGSQDEESVGSRARVYLNGRTQQILLLAGVRGAVSFALVENIPVYDAVRKTGSHFKAELKAMTSSSILFTVFVFGALTYCLIKNERQTSAHGMLSRRLLSDEALDSDNDDDDDRDSSSERSDTDYAISELGAT